MFQKLLQVEYFCVSYRWKIACFLTHIVSVHNLSTIIRQKISNMISVSPVTHACQGVTEK